MVSPLPEQGKMNQFQKISTKKFIYKKSNENNL